MTHYPGPGPARGPARNPVGQPVRQPGGRPCHGTERPRALARLAAAILFVGLWVGALPAQEPALQPAKPAAESGLPRLVVLLHVDSFRADYLERFGPLLSEDGFARLLREGAVFSEARVDHTSSELGPGVTALATGVLPGRAGIPTNVWFDRERRQEVLAAGDDGAVAFGSDEDISKAWASPGNLQRPTLGDLMQVQLGADVRVFSFSWTDTSALLLGGQESDGSYWIDDYTGTWVTSSKLLSALDGYLATENREGAVQRYKGRVWERGFDDETGLAYASRDDDPHEPPFAGFPTFPYEIPEFPLTNNVLRKSIDHTPFNDRVVLDAVRAAFAHRELGKDALPDLLCVSFSSLGYGGRDFGPDSQEVMDIFLQLDARVSELTALLDESVGEGRWTLALSSASGISQLPEKTGGRRMKIHDLQVPVEVGLRQRFPEYQVKDRNSWVVGIGGRWLYLSPLAAERAGVTLAEAAEVAAQLAEGIDGVQAAYTPSAMAASEDPVLRRWAEDLHPGRSGDVLVVLEPSMVFNVGVGTGAGGQSDADRRVPLIFHGAGIQPGVHPGPASALDVVPTLAYLLGVPRMDEAELDGQVRHEALTR